MTGPNRIRALTAIAAFTSTAALAGCGGGGPSSLPTSTAPNISHAITSIRIVIPPVGGAATAKGRRIRSVAYNTNGLAISVYTSPKASHPVPLTTSVVDVSGAPVCAPGGGGRICTVPIAAPVGTDDIVVTSYDLAPVAGAIPGTAHQLGWGMASAQTITFGASNTVSFTLQGVVAAAVLSAPLPQLDPLVGMTQPLAVQALDADGNVIVADGYADASGNPVTIALAVSGGGTTTSVSTPSLTAPSASVTLTYNAGALTTAQSTAGFIATVTATPSNGGTAGTFTLSLGQALQEYALGGFAPQSVAVGSDNRIWFPEQLSNKVGAIAMDGTLTEYTIPTANTAPNSVVKGSDGNIWFIELNQSKIAYVTPAGAFTELPRFGTSQPHLLALGPDNNVWFTDNGGTPGVGFVTPGGAFTEYTAGISASSNPAGIVAGPDGALWFTEQSANQVARVTTTGTVTEYLAGSGAGPNQIVAGPDGRLWFTEPAINKVAAITTAGTLTEYLVPTASSSPSGITVGRDANIWFTETASAANRIAEVRTTGVFTEFPKLPTATSQPGGMMAVGPDGRVWFAEFQSGKIGAMQ